MAASPAAEHPHRVRDLNDAFRRRFSGGRVVLSAGVEALPSVGRAGLLAAIRGFACSATNNDPYRQHDFGTVTVAGFRCFWEIDCSDQSLRFASTDPADPTVTTRVLTVMLSEEY